MCTEQNRNFCSALLSSCVFSIGADRDLVHASQAATVPGASRPPIPGASAAVPGDHGDLVCALLGRKMSRRRTGKKSRRRAASPCRPRACPPSRPTTTRKNRCTRGSAPAPGSRRARQVFRTALATAASRDSLRCFFSNSGRGSRPRIGLGRPGYAVLRPAPRIRTRSASSFRTASTQRQRCHRASTQSQRRRPCRSPAQRRVGPPRSAAAGSRHGFLLCPHAIARGGRRPAPTPFHPRRPPVLPLCSG